MDCYDKVEASLKEICEECKYYRTSECVPSKCNIGFAVNAIKAARINGEQSIEDGINLIPKNDMKVYEGSAIAKGIANVCRLCKECQGNHSENCIVALSRRSLERTHLKDDVVYPGSVLMYIFNVAKQDQGFAEKIKIEYTDVR